MKIFLSYSHEDTALVEPIAISLRKYHKVFFDKDGLAGGKNFHSHIIDQINQSDALIFFISPQSVEKNSYCISELNHARRRWPNPDGKILPIMVADTNSTDIPDYLKAVHIIRHESGNLSFEVIAAVLRLSSAEEHPPLSFYYFAQVDERRLFFERILKSVSMARREIYRSGRGFTEENSEDRYLMVEVIAHEKAALKRGVRIVRLLTNNAPTPTWCNAYAQLVADYPDALRIYPTLADPTLVNLGLVDPGESDAQIQFLFEARTPSIDAETHYESMAGMILTGQPELSRHLKAQFVSTAAPLQRLAPADLRELGARNMYFAYGSNLSSLQMKQRCPSARVYGGAVLYGWKLRFSVYAPHLDALVAGIEIAQSSDKVYGVIYSMSNEDKRNLDKIEFGGYVGEDVQVHIMATQHTVKARTYVPSAALVDEVKGKNIDPNYINLMKAGADEHGMAELTASLNQIGASAL